jgi:hypothetical protein
MLRAIGKGARGRPTLYLGLSFENLARFRAEPMDTFITIKREETGIDVDVVIFSGETEAEMLDKFAPHIDGNTKLALDKRFKS